MRRFFSEPTEFDEKSSYVLLPPLIACPAMKNTALNGAQIIRCCLLVGLCFTLREKAFSGSLPASVSNSAAFLPQVEALKAAAPLGYVGPPKPKNAAAPSSSS